MDKDLNKYDAKDIIDRIFTVRGNQVMIDTHLAEMYAVETKYLNRAVKRNEDRFPESFRFQITDAEYEILQRQQKNLYADDALRFQIGTLEKGRGQHRKYLPYVFTEQGVAMLSAVLRSDVAVNVSIQIMDAFVEMRKLISSNSGLLQRMDRFELKLSEHDHKIEKVFQALESGNNKPAQGIFFNGQVFDAYIFAIDLIKAATRELILIDNYIDETVLTLLSKRNTNVSATIFTSKVSEQLKLDLKKHQQQYTPIDIKELKGCHDRFLIIDQKELYHIGASLKDLGKKWFAFSRMDSLLDNVLEKLTQNA